MDQRPADVPSVPLRRHQRADPPLASHYVVCAGWAIECDDPATIRAIAAMSAAALTPPSKLHQDATRSGGASTVRRPDSRSRMRPRKIQIAATRNPATAIRSTA